MHSSYITEITQVATEDPVNKADQMPASIKKDRISFHLSAWKDDSVAVRTYNSHQ